MDEFDKSIKKAGTTVVPSANFVDITMDKVADLKTVKSGWGYKAWGSALAGLVAVLAVIFIIAPLTQNSSTKTNSASNISTSKSASSNPGKPAPANPAAGTTTPAGTDNASLDSDLSSVSNSINQENSDQSAATSGINDSSQQIAVPTN